MKKLLVTMGLFISSAGFSADSPHPLKDLTFLISQINDGDIFYSELLSGLKKCRTQNYVRQYHFISYDNNAEKLAQEFREALARSDAIITDLLGVNQVEKYSRLAYENKIPLVFAFIKPSEKVLSQYPNIFYISQDELQSGINQGLLISQYVNQHPEVDKNNDNYINIFNMTGLSNDQGDEWKRVAWQINTINNYPGNRFKAKEIINYPSFYSYDRTYKYVKDLVAANDKINDVEIIVAQSDNTAQAIIDALQGTRYSKIPIFSRGITPQGAQNIRQGKIIGTVLSSPSNVGYYACRLAYNYTNKLPINTGIPYLVYKKKIELPYRIITSRNLGDAKL